MRWLIVTGLTALVALGLLSACGDSALVLHAKAATIVGSAGGEARTALLSAREAALDRVDASTEGQPPEARLAASRVERQNWAGALAAFDTFREALSGWVTGIAEAVSGADVLGQLLQLAIAVVQTWDPLASLLQTLGVDVPELPSEVRTLIGGA